MEIKQLKYELQNLLSGKSSASYDATIQAIARHLRGSERTGPLAETKHQNKKKEEDKLLRFAANHQLMLSEIDERKFISSGAEQKVYIKDENHVLKLNDCIYYASWEDYFHSLLLNNYFFSDTAYKFLGFYKNEETLFAIVQQPYVKANQLTDLQKVKNFLESNGFQNTRNHDYKHQKLGIILEDLHDENVLTKNGVLYFIDTVFYIEPEIFWNQ